MIFLKVFAIEQREAEKDRGRESGESPPGRMAKPQSRPFHLALGSWALTHVWLACFQALGLERPVVDDAGVQHRSVWNDLERRKMGSPL